MRFDHRTAVVTGGAKGIGRAVAFELGAHGVEVVVLDVEKEALDKTGEELKAAGYRAHTIVCDMADRESMDRALNEIFACVDKVDILINNAGIYRDNVMKFWLTDPDTWERRWRINVFGTMYMTRGILPGMLERRYGHIVNLGSVAGVYGNWDMVDYSATKGAVISFTKALAKETAPYNVLVTAVSPGSIGEGTGPSELSFSGRHGSFEECAELICFLASDNASYCSGQNYQVDGCRKRM